MPQGRAGTPRGGVLGRARISNQYERDLRPGLAPPIAPLRRATFRQALLVLDERMRAVLARLEQEEVGPPAVPVAPATGRFLFALVAPQTDCEVLEIGAGRGYSTVWLAAGVRYLGGRVLSLERDSETASAWRENVRDAGLDNWAELIEGDALETLPAIDDVFDVVFIDAKKSEYEDYVGLARERVEPGGLIVADNVLSHQDELAAYSEARRADPGLLTVTLPLDRGLELSVVLTDSV